MRNTTPAAREWRAALLAVAGARGALGLVAIPLAPILYPEHFFALVALRPTKEVLLAGGFFVRRGSVSLPPMLAAALPLVVLGVWVFYWVGRAYADELRSEDGLPRWAQRIVPPDRVVAMCRVLERRGRRVIVLGRIAAFPSALLATAAGASGMPPRKFMVADLFGAVLSVAEVVLAGYVLGAAYKSAGPWVTSIGVVALVALLLVVGRRLRRDHNEPADSEGSEGPRPAPSSGRGT